MSARRKRLRRSIKQVVVFLAVILAGYGLWWAITKPQTVTVTFTCPELKANRTYFATVARSEPERARGLMFVRPEDFKDDDAMLFVFEDEAQRSFYMKNTLIPLDIVFMNAAFEVVDILRDMIPLDERNRSSTKPARYALEVRAGSAVTVGCTASGINR